MVLVHARSEQSALRSSLSLRLRAWMGALAANARASVQIEPVRQSPRSQQSSWMTVDDGVSPCGARSCGEHKVSELTGTVVPFPLQFHAPLADLAENIRQRFASLGIADHDPFILRVEHGAHPRLWIDAMAYVEFLGKDAGYRAVVEDVFDARITVESTDIASVAALVRHYIVARIELAGGRGAAS